MVALFHPSLERSPHRNRQQSFRNCVPSWVRSLWKHDWRFFEAPRHFAIYRPPRQYWKNPFWVECSDATVAECRNNDPQITTSLFAKQLLRNTWAKFDLSVFSPHEAEETSLEFHESRLRGFQPDNGQQLLAVRLKNQKHLTHSQSQA